MKKTKTKETANNFVLLCLIVILISSLTSIYFYNQKTHKNNNESNNLYINNTNSSSCSIFLDFDYADVSNVSCEKILFSINNEYFVPEKTIGGCKELSNNPCETCINRHDYKKDYKKEYYTRCLE